MEPQKAGPPILTSQRRHGWSGTLVTCWPLFGASTPLIHSMHMPSYQVMAWPPHGEGARLFTLQQFMIEVCNSEVKVTKRATNCF